MTYKKYPSKITKDYWVHALPNENYLNPTNNCGKWLIFTYTKDLDKTWRIVAEATEKGELGIEAKAGTAKDNPNATDNDIKVICIYTYNSEDKTNVSKIAWKIYELGIAPKVLNYKCDNVTREGRYAIKGDKKISRYSVSIHHFKDKTEREFIRFFLENFK